MFKVVIVKRKVFLFIYLIRKRKKSLFYGFGEDKKSLALRTREGSKSRSSGKKPNDLL
jgi:hypothetical protein